jgi:soluble lytic murein transglycosylase
VLLLRCLVFAFALFVMLVPPAPGAVSSRPFAAALAEDLTLGWFDPDVVRADPSTALGQALEAQRAGDFESARRIAGLAIASASVEHAPLLRWLAASAARELNSPQELPGLLEPLALSEHPLAPWARLWLAQALEGSDAQKALSLVEALTAGSSELESWPGRTEAERLRARLLGKLGREDEAIVELTRLLEPASDDSAPLTVMMPLADVLSTRTDVERERALQLYRAVAARVPMTRLGRRADERAEALLAALPEERRSALHEPSRELRLMRADALLADLRFADAETAYDALERSVADDPRLACRVRFGRAKALLDRRARAQGSVLMAQVADECLDDLEQHAWARYHAGRAFSALGQNELAIAQYEALERESPTHRLADDALFRAAKVARDMGDDAGVRSRLALIPTRYPAGDMGPRARFALAFHLRAHGELAQAVDMLAPDTADEEAEDLRGRAGYFRARFLLELNRKAEAADAFAAVCEATPLSYYGQQAHARLHTLDAARAALLFARLSHAEAPPLRFELTSELKSPGFARAVALFAAGDVVDGSAELRALGISNESKNPEHTWLTVALLDRAGAPHLAVELARKRVGELLGRVPRGRDLALYHLVYPHAFAPLIEDTAQRESVPAAFVRAVAREESGFFPRAVSRAKARGLIQLLEPTAKAIAKDMGLPHHPDALARPEVNLAIGARFISTLAGSLAGQYALVPVAYNAGPSVASRWLGERASEPLDVWVENIPYDETRHYTRRVLQSYGIYSFLQTGQLLDLPLTLPAL